MVRDNPRLFDDYVSEADFYGGRFGPVRPGGSVSVVTEIDTSRPDRTSLTWSGSEKVREIAKGTEVVVGGRRYRTMGRSTAGFIYLPPEAGVAIGDSVSLPGDDGGDAYLITVRRNARDPSREAVHAVSWLAKPVPLQLYLDAREFPVPPTMLVTAANPTPKRVEPRLVGDAYVYDVGNSIWAVLY
jgi:hypothetical protein